MKQNLVFECIDAHTCGNPVRVITSGKPNLKGTNMAEKRLDFLKHYDWIRTGLMFEPRGHDMMSGSFLYPPSDPSCDIGILFIETSGCLPMCGHGSIGTVTVIIEKKLVSPATPGTLVLETPAGKVIAEYTLDKNEKVSSVKLTNVPSFLFEENISITVPDIGELVLDISYGGNFYAIVDIQKNFKGIDDFSAQNIIKYSPIIRNILNDKLETQHPTDAKIKGIKHVLWAGNILSSDSTARNAVFYGDKAIDRSPCGTGTSARMAQWYSKNKLKVSEKFYHESIIGSIFVGEILEETKVGKFDAIIPQVSGWAKITGENKIFLNQDDPYVNGFQVV